MSVIYLSLLWVLRIVPPYILFVCIMYIMRSANSKQNRYNIWRGNSWSGALRIRTTVWNSVTIPKSFDRHRKILRAEWINSLSIRIPNCVCCLIDCFQWNCLHTLELYDLLVEIINKLKTRKHDKYMKLVQTTRKISTWIKQKEKKVQIKMKQVFNTVTNTGWNTFWWILGSICMPITTPYIVNKVVSLLKFRKNRDTLTGKVSAKWKKSVPRIDVQKFIQKMLIRAKGFT